MKKLFLVLILIFTVNIAYSQQWFNKVNGTANITDEAKNVAVDQNGNSYVTGFINNLLTGQDIYTVKYDSNGTALWVKQIKGAGADVAYAITVDGQDNIIIGGYTTRTATGSDLLVTKYSNSGDSIWSFIFAGNGGIYPDVAYAITVDGQDNIYIGGTTYTTSNGQEFTLIKLNSSGVQQWIKTYNGSPGNSSDEAYAITVDAQDNVIVTGKSFIGNEYDYITVKYNSAGDTLWTRLYNGTANNKDEAYAITVDGADNVYVTGESKNNGTQADIVTIKYSPAGVQLWTKIYNNNGINSDDIGKDLVATSDGAIIVIGSSKKTNGGDSEDFVTIKYNAATGDSLWVRRYDGQYRDIPYSVKVTDSYVFVSGETRLTSSAGSEDMLVIRYNLSNGLQPVLATLPNPGSDAANSIRLNSNNDLFVVGFSSTTGLGPDFAALKYKNGLIKVSNISTEVPNGFVLGQNYPNPFNPSTKIRFAIPSSGRALMNIYNSAGQFVKTVMAQNLQPGEYELDFNMNGLSSGVYFYELTLEKEGKNIFRDSKKMLLIK